MNLKPKLVKKLESKVKELRNLEKEIDKLRNKAECKNYYGKLASDKRELFVTKELKKGNMIWCRQGSVVSEATPCHLLACPFKDRKLDILTGIRNLNCSFQVTTKSHDWENARHINIER